MFRAVRGQYVYSLSCKNSVPSYKKGHGIVAETVCLGKFHCLGVTATLSWAGSLCVHRQKFPKMYVLDAIHDTSASPFVQANHIFRIIVANDLEITN